MAYCNICNDRIHDLKAYEFNGKCEECFYNKWEESNYDEKYKNENTWKEQYKK